MAVGKQAWGAICSGMVIAMGLCATDDNARNRGRSRRQLLR